MIGAGRKPPGATEFGIVQGVSARTDAEGDVINPAAVRIRDLCTLAGQPVADTDVFLIVTNTYRAAGGGHFPAAAACETVFISPAPPRCATGWHGISPGCRARLPRWCGPVLPLHLWGGGAGGL